MAKITWLTLRLELVHVATDAQPELDKGRSSTGLACSRRISDPTRFSETSRADASEQDRQSRRTAKRLIEYLSAAPTKTSEV